MTYDSPRMTAAMKALREDQHHPLRAAPRRAATIALTAADAVMFEDSAIERAAQALEDADVQGPLTAPEIVRTVIAALKGSTL